MIKSGLRASGGSLLNATPEAKKELDEKINRLLVKYQIDSLADVGKVSVQLEVPHVKNSMDVFAEHYQTKDQLSFEFFDSLLLDEKNQWYLDQMDWEQLDAYEDMTPEERKEYHARLLAAEKFVSKEFIEKLRALDEAQKKDTSGDFEKGLEWAQKKHALLKEYVKSYEQQAGHKWSRDILAHIAQLKEDNAEFVKAPEDLYYDVMGNEKVIDKQEPDPQQSKYRHRLIFNGREFSETMYPKYE